MDLMVAELANRGLCAAAAMRKHRVVCLLVLMVVAFLLSWIPIIVMGLCKDFRLEEPYGISPQFFLAMAVCKAIALSSCIWIPLLYFWLSSSHLKDLKRYFARLSCTIRTGSRNKEGSLGYGFHRVPTPPRISISYATQGDDFVRILMELQTLSRK